MSASRATSIRSNASYIVASQQRQLGVLWPIAAMLTFCPVEDTFWDTAYHKTYDSARQSRASVGREPSREWEALRALTAQTASKLAVEAAGPSLASSCGSTTPPTSFSNLICFAGPKRPGMSAPVIPMGHLDITDRYLLRSHAHIPNQSPKRAHPEPKPLIPYPARLSLHGTVSPATTPI